MSGKKSGKKDKKALAPLLNAGLSTIREASGENALRNWKEKRRPGGKRGGKTWGDRRRTRGGVASQHK